MTVAVLFARQDSIYKSIPDCDVWDIDRDARKWPGGVSIVAHPPCRAWGSLRLHAKPREGEKELAIWSVDQIRRWGGVLEHPYASKLWPVKGLPNRNERDSFGGFTVVAPQFWWGHPANKATRFYICGMEPKDLPPIPLVLGDAEFVVTTNHSYKRKRPQRPELTKTKDREGTPEPLARWLVEVAKRCKPNP